MRIFRVFFNVLFIKLLLTPYLVFGYAWERDKDKKYYDYGLTFDPGYTSFFNYHLDKKTS